MQYGPVLRLESITLQMIQWKQGLKLKPLEKRIVGWGIMRKDDGGDGAGGAEASSDNLAGNSPASSNSNGGADEVLPDITRQ